MKKKEFQSRFSDYTDTSNCGLETERRTESSKGFEAYIYDDTCNKQKRALCYDH